MAGLVERHRGGRRDAGGAQPAPSVVAGGQHHHGRRRHRRARHAPGLPQVAPLDPRAADGLGPGLVRRLPALHLLLPVARSPHRALQRRRLLRRGLQGGHGARHPPLAAVRLGVRPPGRPPRPRPGLPGRGHPAVPVRTELLDLRGQPALHPGRRVLVLPQPLPGPAVPRRGGARPPHRPAPGLGRGALRLHPALPPAPGPVRRGRRSSAGAARRRPGAGAAPRAAGPPGPSPLGPAPLLGRGGRRLGRRARRLVAGSLRHRPGLHHQHGVDQRRRLPPPPLPRLVPVGAGRQPARAGGHGHSPQPGGVVDRHPGRHRRRGGLP